MVAFAHDKGLLM